MQRRFSSAALPLLLLAPLAAVAGENEYWSATYRNVR